MESLLVLSCYSSFNKPWMSLYNSTLLGWVTCEKRQHMFSWRINKNYPDKAIDNLMNGEMILMSTCTHNVCFYGEISKTVP